MSDPLITTLAFAIPYTIMVGIVGYLIYKVEKLEGEKCKEKK